jgi:hypothetical protein
LSSKLFFNELDENPDIMVIIQNLLADDQNPMIKILAS